MTDALCFFAGLPTLSSHPPADVEFPPLHAGRLPFSMILQSSQRGEQTQLVQSNSPDGVTGGAQWGVAGLSRGSWGTCSNSGILGEHVLSPVVESIDDAASQSVGESASMLPSMPVRCEPPAVHQ